MTDSTPEERYESWFLIPLVRDSDRCPHSATLWGLLRDEVYAVAAGWSGPTSVVAIKESVRVVENVEAVPGGWKDLITGRLTEDESRKYTVLIPRDQVEVRREVLARAANSFDQAEILFVVRGLDRTVKRDPAKGFLKGDPSEG